MQNRIGEAATTPLRDLNLAQDAIPAILQEAKQKPYFVPADQSCTTLYAEVRALDAVIGPDIDAPGKDGERGLMERGGDAAGDAVIGAFQRTVEGVVPFRSWIRKLSGAERRAREVAEALLAGGARRAFLKGMASARGCANYYDDLAASAVKEVKVDTGATATATATATAVAPAVAPAPAPALSEPAVKADQPLQQ